MDYPFIQGISDIQQTQAMGGSRTTLPFSPRNNDLLLNLRTQTDMLHANQGTNNSIENLLQPKQSFFSLRDYVEKTLNSWGMKIGYLPQNYENSLTINTLMQLISQKFNDQQSRQQLKKSLSQSTFQRNKFQSLLQQQRQSNVEKNKAIGRLQNTISELKTKMKQIQITAKKQKQQDKKMIYMLQSKNQQILHEVKKRQQQSNRLKQQMKKNVGQKGPPKNVNFQVYEVKQKQQNSSNNDRIEQLNQKHQTERKHFMKENLLLRQKIYDIRQQIVQFSEWIDRNLFKETGSNYKNKLLVNHNLLFKKQSIVDEFREILNDARSGIQQLINMQERLDQLQRLSLQPRLSQKIRASQYIQNYQQNKSPNKIKINADFKKIQPRQTMPTQKKNSITEKARQTMPNSQTVIKKHQKILKQEMEPQFQDQQSQISIISHISSKDIVVQNQKFDKWDLLFNHD